MYSKTVFPVCTIKSGKESSTWNPVPAICVDGLGIYKHTIFIFITVVIGVQDLIAL